MKRENQTAVGYFRVSSEEQLQGYSIAAQKRAFYAYCRQHGYQVAGEYLDEGRSAKSDKVEARPAFAQMLDDLVLGEFDLIVVHKMDRFSRSMRVAVQAFERLGRANVGLVSVSEPNIDYGTPQGKLMMHMLWTLAQFYSDNLSQEVKKGLSERRAQGLANGSLPFGYRKGDDGLVVVDDEVLENGRTRVYAVRLMFRLAGRGHSCAFIADTLNALGFRTSSWRGVNEFGKSTVNAMLVSRFYLGELPDGDYRPGVSRRGHYTLGHRGLHPAIISQRAWKFARLALQRNRKSGGSLGISITQLSGVRVRGNYFQKVGYRIVDEEEGIDVEVTC